MGGNIGCPRKIGSSRSGDTDPSRGISCSLGTPQQGPFEDGVNELLLGMGCFWGAERLFWSKHKVFAPRPVTQVEEQNPTYQDLLRIDRAHRSGRGLVPGGRPLAGIPSQTFWENHDPTQGMRQGKILAPTDLPFTPQQKPSTRWP